jgi:hypothetical protein
LSFALPEGALVRLSGDLLLPAEASILPAPCLFLLLVPVPILGLMALRPLLNGSDQMGQ